jgi:nuclear transport factor 2 (NTF2) superfamily protein
MPSDTARISDLARSYTEAWCSRDPARVAAHYSTGGTISVNGGEPAPIEDVARSFVDAFPDILVFMDDLAFDSGAVVYRWTFTGTSSSTGMAVRIPGYEEWSIDADGLITESRGFFDEAEYERQVEHGA